MRFELFGVSNTRLRAPRWALFSLYLT